MPLLLLLLPTLTACGATSRSTPPVVVAAPVLTPLPAEISEIAPPPSGAYWRELTAWRNDLRAQLKGMPVK